MGRHGVVRVISALAIGASLVSAAAAAPRDDRIAQFYKGRQVTLYIGAAVGGGYDAYARLVGRYIGAYIPGNPTVVPTNMPGAGGAVLISHLLTAAPRDGSALAAIQPGAITAPLYSGRKGPQFDVRRLIYLGSANSEDDGCWARADAAVKTYRDVFSKPLIIGGSAAGDTSVDLPTVQNNVLGTKFKIISGYTGTNQVLLAVDKNEVQGLCGAGMPTIMTQRPQWVKSGFVKMLVQENADGAKQLNAAGVPRSPDFAKTPEDRKVLDLIYVQQKFGRPYAMPPSAPPEQVAVLRRAFVQALGDKRLLAEAKRMNLDIEGMAGDHLQTLVDDLYQTPPGIVDKARVALGYAAGQRN